MDKYLLHHSPADSVGEGRLYCVTTGLVYGAPESGRVMKHGWPESCGRNARNRPPRRKTVLCSSLWRRPNMYVPCRPQMSSGRSRTLLPLNLFHTDFHFKTASTQTSTETCTQRPQSVHPASTQTSTQHPHGVQTDAHRVSTVHSHRHPPSVHTLSTVSL